MNCGLHLKFANKYTYISSCPSATPIFISGVEIYPLFGPNIIEMYKYSKQTTPIFYYGLFASRKQNNYEKYKGKPVR